jgi:hypothetical protein
MADEDMCRKFPPDEEGKREYSDMCYNCYEEVVAVLYGNYKEPEVNYDFVLRGSYSLSEVSGDGS